MINNEKLEIRYFGISDLIPYQDNAKLHDIGAIADMIKRYGFKDPIKLEPSLNNGRGGIVEGNGRLETLLWMKHQGQDCPRGIDIDDSDGEWLVPVIVGVDAESEGEAIAYSLDHNNSVLSGGTFTALDATRMWEQNGYLKLLEELDQAESLPETVDEEDYQLILSMIDEADEEDLSNSSRQSIKDPLAGVEQKCQFNQVWQLGKHKLIIRDSCDEEYLRDLNLLPDLVIADPPFGFDVNSSNIGSDQSAASATSGNLYKSIVGDNSLDTTSRFLELYPRLYEKAKFCVWGANHFCHLLQGSPGWIIWDKRGEDIPSNTFADCEIAWTNFKSPARIYRQVWHGMIREGEGESQSRFHVNQKPVRLFEWIYELAIPEGGTVVDPFCGSGSSILAAFNLPLDISITAFEIDPDFADVIIHRWEDLTGEVATAI